MNMPPPTSNLTRPARSGFGRLLLLSALLVLALAPVGCSPDDDADNGFGQQASPVQVATVQERTLADTVRGIGSLRARETVVLRPEIEGSLTQVHFEEGDTVDAGNLLFTIDDRKLQRELESEQASLASAQVRAQNAQRRFERTQTLFQREVAAEDELDEAQADLDTAQAEIQRIQAQIELIRERLADAEIYAPIAGTMSESEVDAGNYVRVGDELATLYQTQPIEARFSLPQRYLGRVEIGQTVDLTLAGHDETFQGQLIAVSPSVDAQTRQFTVRARVDNPDHALRPGTFVNASLTLDLRENRPVIPEQALISTRTGYIVFTVNDEHAHRQDVEIGLRDGNWVEITAGLEPGQRVIRTGHMNVSDGDAVNIVNNDNAVAESQ